MIRDAKTGVQITSGFTVRVIPPRNLPCPRNTTRSSDGSCNGDISVFDVKGQLHALFTQSSLDSFNNVGALKTWVFYESQIFWVNSGAAVIFATALILFRIKTFREFCIIKDIEHEEKITKLRGYFSMFLVNKIFIIL
jgi:hypothetical protein